MLLFLMNIQSAKCCVLPHVSQYVTCTRMASFMSHFCRRCRIFTSQKVPVTIVSRSVSRQVPRLPLDAENLGALITEDITVFTYRNNRFFLLLTVFGGLQFLCWANIAHIIKSDQTTEKLQKQKPQKYDDSWMGKFYAANRIKIAATCLGLGFTALFFTIIYPLRTVAQLRLLKGGRDVGVTTYWHFGRLRYFTVPLDDVSCRKSRTASPSYVSMKIRGHWMYFMLDVRDGRFHEPELFDYVIGLNRSLK